MVRSSVEVAFNNFIGQRPTSNKRIVRGYEKLEALIGPEGLSKR
jgi:hypothetical protein